MVVCVLRWGRWDWRPGGSSLGVSSCRSDDKESKLTLDALLTWR